MKFSIELKVLKAIALFRSRDDTRPQIGGVNVTVGDMEAQLVATNGRVMGCIKVGVEEQGFFREHLDVSALKGRKDAIVAIDTDCLIKTETGRYLPAAIGNTVQIIPIIESQFPTGWASVVPLPLKPLAQAHTAVNPELVAPFGKAAQLLVGLPGITVQFTGERDPLVISIPACSDFLGVLMPMHLDPPQAKIPEWILKRAVHSAVKPDEASAPAEE